MSRRSNLLPPYLAANPAWVQMVEAIDDVFENQVDLPTELLSKLRDNWILGAVGAEKIGTETMLDNTDWFRFERETLIRQANQIGFLLKETDLLTDEEYQRLVRNLGAFWYNKGTPEFIDFMRFILGSIIDVRKLFALPGPTWDSYGEMREEGDVLIGKLNYEFEEILTPLLLGDAELMSLGGSWSAGPNLERVGIAPGPTGLMDAVIYRSLAGAGSSLFRPFPFENNTNYRLEVWLRKLGGPTDTSGFIGADSDFDGDVDQERVSEPVGPVPLVWAKYRLDFTTSSMAAAAANFAYALADFVLGAEIAVAQPQLYKVTETSVPGEWFETSHVHMIVDPLHYVPGSLQKMIALFNVLANYHLVLDTVVFETPIIMHPPGAELGAIVKAYPMIDIEVMLYSGDPSPPAVSSIPAVTPTPEAGVMTFIVNLNKSSSVPFSIGYSRSGTATPDVDFTGPVLSDGVFLTGSVLQVPPGVASFTLTFTILADAVSDPGETITITVGSVTRSGTIT